jgi:hypothetical protein
MKAVSLAQEQATIGGFAKFGRVSQHAIKHRRKLARGTRNYTQHLRRGRLLLQRFRQVGCASRKVSGALAQFVEQPRVLDGNDGLGGEVFTQLDLFIAEGLDFLAIHAERPNKLVLLQHWHHQNRPYSPKFDTCNDPRIAISVGFLRAQISDVNHFFIGNHTSGGGLRPWTTTL